MREILFRGKRVDNGEWVYGNLIHKKASVGNKALTLIVGSAEWDTGTGFYHLCNVHRIVPETIGQYTGLTDKNGKKIFGGDIVRYNVWHCNPKGTIESVEWVDVCCGFEPFSDSKNNCGHCGGGVSSENSEVIGNIHDNPELLKVEKIS